MGVGKGFMKEEDHLLAGQYYLRLYGIDEYYDFGSLRAVGKVVREIVVQSGVIVPAEVHIKTRLMHVDTDLVVGGHGVPVHSQI